VAPGEASALTWQQLKNATYLFPEDWGGPPDGLLPMEDGTFTYAPIPGAASVENYFLYRGVAFGDIDGDGAEDAAVVLIHSPAGTGVFYHLSLVRNASGEPDPLAPVFLGDRIIVEKVQVTAGEVSLLFRTYRDEEPFGSTPTLQVAHRYGLSEHTLELVDSETLNLDEVVSEAPEAEPIAIAFPEGERSVELEGTTRAFGLATYTLLADEGQALQVKVTSPNDDVFLSIYGLEQPGILVRSQEEVASWSGDLPATQQYAINVFAIGLETDYRLWVELSSAPPAPTETPQPLPTAAPTATDAPGTVPPLDTGSSPGDEGERVLYLTFDDGPTPPYTPEMLELLAEYDAQVTFFILGRHAERFTELLQPVHQAGHALGNHTYNHRSLAGISAEDFQSEVEETAALLGDWEAPCLRPPYGATDAFTRPRAAELGYEVVLWNVDPLDWKQPPAEEIAASIVEHAHPGAIVLMHDGGGDRSQSVAALRLALAELADEGYAFRSICEPAG
jgi:peptidoglycan/xylan/chitin deacetylase (PgdA/CDA1 family)